MTKTELIDKLADKSALTKVAAGKVLDNLAEMIGGELKRRGGGEFTLPGVGKLSVIKTKARTGRNPRTGEPVKIAAGRRVRFTASKTLKDVVNG